MEIVRELMTIYFIWAGVAWIFMALTSLRVIPRTGFILWLVTVTLSAGAWPLFLDGKYYRAG